MKSTIFLMLFVFPISNLVQTNDIKQSSLSDAIEFSRDKNALVIFLTGPKDSATTLHEGVNFIRNEINKVENPYKFENTYFFYNYTDKINQTVALAIVCGYVHDWNFGTYEDGDQLILPINFPYFMKNLYNKFNLISNENCVKARQTSFEENAIVIYVSSGKEEDDYSPEEYESIYKKFFMDDSLSNYEPTKIYTISDHTNADRNTALVAFYNGSAYKIENGYNHDIGVFYVKNFIAEIHRIIKRKNAQDRAVSKLDSLSQEMETLLQKMRSNKRIIDEGQKILKNYNNKNP